MWNASGNKLENATFSYKQIEYFVWHVNGTALYKFALCMKFHIWLPWCHWLFVLQQSLRNQSQSVENSFLHESHLLDEKESLAEVKKHLLQEKASFEEERRKFAEVAAKLGKEVRKGFFLPFSIFQQMVFWGLWY